MRLQHVNKTSVFQKSSKIEMVQCVPFSMLGSPGGTGYDIGCYSGDSDWNGIENASVTNVCTYVECVSFIMQFII